MQLFLAAGASSVSVICNDRYINEVLAPRGQGNYVTIGTERCPMKERGRPRSFDRGAALQRAMEVFWAKGYGGASMAELTTAMGINSPSLYAAFGSKEKLFEEAVALYTTSEGTDIWDALPEAATAREAVAQ